KMMEGLAELAHVVGLGHAFRARAQATLRPRDQHIRFIKEAHAGAPFAMTGCVLEVSEHAVLVYQQITHQSGEPCASFRTWVDHVDVDTGAAFSWTAATRQRLEALIDQPPAATAPRSVDMSVAVRPSATMADTDAINAPVIGRGVVLPQQLDLNDVMMPEFFIGRVSDSIAHLLRPWREKVAAEADSRGETLRMGGAVLEYRLVYRRWPRAGDRFVIRSGRGIQRENTHSFVHWIIDPDSGLAWCTSEAVAVSLNLDTRKIIPSSPELMKLLMDVAPEGLTV
ncbi:MAG: thioesterase family protein, partial [Hyphomonadaceae bacterium]